MRARLPQKTGPVAMMRKEIIREGEYDENGNYVGPKPQTDLEYAQENWVGGYDEEEITQAVVSTMPT